MEQAQHWLWMKRKQLLKSQLQASMNSISSTGSWEEKAFAEDHASSGHLGGCIWPPRSYSCSFCKREFRSAQALGGHMNVHRRDRARLKQSLSPHNDVYLRQNHIQSSLQSLESHFSSSDQVCTLDNYDLDHPKLVSVPRTSTIASTLSSSRVSDFFTQENSSDHALVSRFSSSFVQEQHGGRYPYDLHNNISGRSDRSLAISFQSKPEAETSQGEADSTCLSHDNFNATDLFIGQLGSVINGQSSSSPGYCGNEAIGCKRPKTNVSVLSLLIKPRSDNRCILQSEATGPNYSSKEDIDLELRLGESSQVK